jgi:alkyldihydroxyacetonephosphate synthase
VSASATTTAGRRRSFWGWGYEDQQPSPAELREAAAGIVGHLGFGDPEVELPVALEDVALPAPRLEPPPALAELCSTDRHARVSHARGKSYRDIVRGFRGDFEHLPDVVAFPREERDVEELLAWCGTAGAAAIPYGGGTSVVGGIDPVSGKHAGAVTIDLGRLDRVLEVDEVSRAARIQAGATGPGLEQQLRAHGLTLRHFPQSFELSTLGGWIATRAGGHFATLYTHIDDLVESVRAVTPAGVLESRRLPGSGAGPSPDRMLLGSEGILGVITEAWVRVQPRPRFKSSVAVRFESFAAGAEAVRALSQSGLHPSNCRLLDGVEAALTGATPVKSEDGGVPAGDALLVLGFESADHPIDGWMARALELCRDHGGDFDEPRSGGRQDAVGSWRETFLRAPYLRDTLIAASVVSETFETAVTWDRFPTLHQTVTEATTAAVREACGAGRVMCRFTHVYPDGPAPYFTVLAAARRGAELEQWDAIKRAASDAVIACGGTITHHHAVGRDHRPWYDRQRPPLFAEALVAAKRTLDPAGILNPGVLVDPLRAG